MDELRGDPHAIPGTLYRTSTIPSTPSSLAISGSDSFVCLYCIEEVREMTFRERICARSVINASVNKLDHYRNRSQRNITVLQPSVILAPSRQSSSSGNTVNPQKTYESIHIVMAPTNRHQYFPKKRMTAAKWIERSLGPGERARSHCRRPTKTRRQPSRGVSTNALRCGRAITNCTGMPLL